jgi:hypothetical protein
VSERAFCELPECLWSSDGRATEYQALGDAEDHLKNVHGITDGRTRGRITIDHTEDT